MPLLAYGALSALFFLLPVIDRPRGALIASDDIDASTFMWMLAWWPDAILDGRTPWLTDLLLVPDGYNMMWTTSMPGPSLVLAPVTLALGPVATWNALALLAPALSAWTAYLLCRHVTGDVAASLAGGYVFGFSPYMLGQIAGHPAMALVAFIPLGALLFVKRVEGTIGPRAYVIAMAAVIVGQFTTSTETIATATLVGALALLIAYALLRERRAALRRAALLTAGAYAAAGVVVGPLLYAFLFEGGQRATQALVDYPADLASWVVPGHYVLVSSGHTPDGVPDYASGFAYVGVPLALLAVLFAWRYRARREALLLVACLAVAFVLSLGSFLIVAGTDTGVPLPWRAIADLPVLEYAIPIRLSAYAFLALGVIVALWLAWTRRWWAWALALVGIALLLPDFGNARWETEISQPAFYDEAVYGRYLEEGDVVLGVPPWRGTMRWQADEGYPFALAGGYLGAFPPGYDGDPAFETLLTGRPKPGATADLRRFVREKGVTAIVVDKAQPGPWRSYFAPLGVRPVDTGGVLFYRLRPAPRG